MKNAAFSIEELFRFLDAGVSAFHSTAAASAILEAEGYVNCPCLLYTSDAADE